MSRTVPFQDGWGDGRKTRVSECDSDTQDDWVPENEPEVQGSTNSRKPVFAILADELPFYAEAIRKLTPKEWGVFFLFHVRKLGSQAQVAKALSIPTGDVWNYLKRIDSKLGRLQRELNLYQVRFADPEDGDASEIPVLLSFSQPTQPVADAHGKRAVCRGSASWCQERTTP